MKNLLRCATGIFCAIAFMYGAGRIERAVYAQAITAASPYSFQVTGTLANCPVVASGVTQFCFTTTGLYQSVNGGTWALVSGGTSGAVTQVNSTAPGPTGNVTVSCTASFPATPASFAAGNTTSATVPSISIPVTCSAKGS